MGEARHVGDVEQHAVRSVHHIGYSGLTFIWKGERELLTAVREQETL